MTLDLINRRDGEVVPFDRSRIETAITAACDAIGETEKNFIPKMTDAVIGDLIVSCDSGAESHIPSVEKIQDLVEKHLMKEGQ